MADNRRHWCSSIARVVYVAIYIAGVPVVRTLVWAVGWVGLADDAAAAARKNLTHILKNNEAPGPLPDRGHSRLVHSGGSGCLASSSAPCSSLRSAFICLVSMRANLVDEASSRPTMTFSNLSTVLPVDVTAMALRELQIRAIAGDLER